MFAAATGMRPLILFWIAILGTAACSPISPSGVVTGNWKAQEGHSTFYSLALTQDGRIIGGTACAWDAEVLSGFREVPVTGRYPTFQFTEPRYGSIFTGKYEAGRDEIPIDVNGKGTNIRFTRGGTGQCPR